MGSSNEIFIDRQWSVRVWRELGALTIPVLVGNLLQQTYNVVDAIVIGYYFGESAFSAIGIAGTLTNLLLFLLFGCSNGIGIIVAELYGKQDYSLLRKELRIALLTGITFTIFISVLSMALLIPLLSFLATPDLLKPLVCEYVHIIQIFLIISFANNCLFSVLRAINAAQYATYYLSISMLINVLLDVLLIGILNMGISGAAYATVVAQAISVSCSLVHIIRKKSFLLGKEFLEKSDFYLFRRTLSYSFVSALHMSSLYIGRMLVQGIVNTIGLAEISAFTATSRIESLAQSVSTSVAESLGLYIAKSRGAEDKYRINKGLQDCFVFLLCSGIIVSMIMVLIPSPLMLFMLKSASEQTIRAGTGYFRIVGFAYPLCYLGNLFLGYCRGSGQVVQQFLITTSHLMIRVIVSWLLIKQFHLTAVAIGTCIGWFAMILFQFASFSRCKRKDPFLLPSFLRRIKRSEIKD